MTDRNCCPHEWIQCSTFTPAWVSAMPPTPVSPQPNPVTPNPVLPSSSTLPMCAPLELRKVAPRTLIVTVSIPAESIFTLPSNALEIKMIRKNLKLTQCRFFNSPPPAPCIPHDTPKLFLGGFVRKDIQYSEPARQTVNTVEGSIKDFVIDLPFTCVVDLGNLHGISPTRFSGQQEYEFSSTTPLPLGFSTKDKLMSGDMTEFNAVSQEFYNSLPNYELIYSQIQDMNDPLDRVSMANGPFEEGIFRTVQEKMVILLQLRVTFPNEFNPPPVHCTCQSQDQPIKNPCCPNPIFAALAKLLKCLMK
ncbi:hypothetical protein REC12_06790 [Desulfosporosinus sp. PR]|uniref:CsxC family protein n=1 Tax=Candidatus Desulfosporosinus nitrosoreducens TaxID=3401928 RepID=UPI0027F3F886|nr:hypothetical protein [Desulfosporosinus sp. PR]MDQ7093292.1 hypothetical protein [Desulfosporosinus sp. PR]